MTKKQAVIIITLLAVLVLITGSMTAVLFRDSGAEAESDKVALVTPATSVPQTLNSTSKEVEDPAEVLASAEVNSIHPAPAPDAPEEWGDYKIHDSWDGQIRVSDSSGPQEITSRNADRFPSTMNSCGVGMYFVTFKSVNPNVDLRVHLLDAIGDSAVSEEISQGWTISTNCETPAMEFLEAEDTSTLGDVVYTVHEYRQSSVEPLLPAEPVAPSVVEASTVAPAIVAEPTLVQCLGYLVPTGLYSDGSERRTQSCADSPEQQRAARAEGVCGGFYGWLEVSADEYLDLCGIMPPTHLVPEPTESYDTDSYVTEPVPTDY